MRPANDRADLRASRPSDRVPHGSDRTDPHHATGNDRLIGQKGVIDRTQTHAHDPHHWKVEGAHEISKAFDGQQRPQN